MTCDDLLKRHRDDALSEAGKGAKFERLMRVCSDALMLGSAEK